MLAHKAELVGRVELLDSLHAESIYLISVFREFAHTFREKRFSFTTLSVHNHM